MVTGLDGKGNEIVFTFKAGAKTDGGICLNKWDICRQNPYFVGGQGSAGFSAPIMRVADAILMLAEVKAELGADAEAINLVNQIRERAFGNTDHNIAGLSGDALKDAVLMERKLELLVKDILATIWLEVPNSLRKRWRYVMRWRLLLLI